MIYFSIFAGIEYLQEILKSNPLKNLEQLHLFTRDSRSKKFLDKNCAEFLLRHFVSLKHFGTLKHWRLTRSERADIVSKAVKENRNITFDEDLKANRCTENLVIDKRYGNTVDFNARYVEFQRFFKMISVI